MHANYWWGQMHCAPPTKILGGPWPTRLTLQRPHDRQLKISMICLAVSSQRLSFLDRATDRRATAQYYAICIASRVKKL